MKIVLTKFAEDHHFDSAKAGTTITDRVSEDFEREVNDAVECSGWAEKRKWCDGYAPFCKHLFLCNWTDTRTGTMPITSGSEQFLKSAYKSREPNELPVLVRWFEGLDFVPRAEWLDLVLYHREHLAEEGTDIGDADYGIVAILGQLDNRVFPMTPITAMRNALGIREGGSGVSLDRQAYAESVEFWNKQATV